MSLGPKKEELRKHMKGVISSLSVQQRAEKSSMIVHQLCGFFRQKSVCTLAVFVPLASEPNISEFVDRIEMQGRRVVFPHTSKTTYAFVSLKTPEIIRGKSVNVMLVPGIAFTQGGKRLGRGGGWYDRVIAHCRVKNHDLLTIGVCFAEQIVADIPVGEYDQIMDYSVYA